MKLNLIIATLLMAAQAIALETATPFTSSVMVNGKKNYQFVNPLTQNQNAAVRNNNPPRQIEGLSTRAWTTTAIDWNPAKTAFSDDERNREAHFNLIWLGAEPPND